MLVCMASERYFPGGHELILRKVFLRGPKSGELCFLPLKTKKTAFQGEIFKFLPPSDQARNQLGTPREAKS